MATNFTIYMRYFHLWLINRGIVYKYLLLMRDLVESIGPQGELETVGYYFPKTEGRGKIVPHGLQFTEGPNRFHQIPNKEQRIFVLYPSLIYSCSLIC